METQPSCSSVEEEVCWICLDGGESAPLAQVCRCPRKCHERCLARWQLHSAGRSEERTCRFCHSELHDWKPVMAAATGAKPVTPYMRVSFNGKTHKVQVRPGDAGAREFELQIRQLLQLPEDQQFDVIFHARAPGTGEKLQLHGLNAYDAAVHCASLSTRNGGKSGHSSGGSGGASAPAPAPLAPTTSAPATVPASAAAASSAAANGGRPAPQQKRLSLIGKLMQRIICSPEPTAALPPPPPPAMGA